MFVNGIDIAVTGGFKPGAHLLDVELLADIQHQAAAEQELGRRQAVQGGGDRHHQHAVRQLGQPVQAGDALGNDVLVRREQVVGQGFPVGKVQYGQIRGEETQLLFQPFGTLAVGGQQQGKALGSAGGLGDGQAQGGTGQVAPVLFTCRGREKR
ncbi:hypothetical protein D3C73_771760 [compost metagenome]